MATRTAILGVGLTTAGVSLTLATVPAGETWILKSCNIINIGAVNTMVKVTVNHATGGHVAAMFFAVVNAASEAYQERWIVAEPGDVIAAESDSAAVDVWLNGAQLAGVAP